MYQILTTRRPCAASFARWALLAAVVAGTPAFAQDAPRYAWAAFVQAGTSDNHTHAVTVGAQLPWAWRKPVGGGEVSGFWDLSLSRWTYPSDADRSHGLLTQIGAIPTARWTPGWLGQTFLELGVGATLMSDLYRTNGKRFSTRFNFGSHLGVGLPLDAQGTQEIVLRFEHFSNAGIRHPNPGENFLQVRYAHHF